VVQIMMSVIFASNWFSSIYFVVWIILGNYILLTLFLAVVMEAFEGKYDMDSKDEQVLHTYYTTLQFIPTILHYTTLHYTTLHYTTLHYTSG
jgi:hypothetical protein